MAKKLKNLKCLSTFGGINPFPSDQNKRNHFAYTKNIVPKNGKPVTREGIVPVTNTPIGNYDALGWLSTPLTVTETVYAQSGRLAYDIWTDGVTFAYVNAYIFQDDASLDRIGSITVGSPGGQFFMPKNVVFLTGEPVNGTGLYLFLCCTPGTQTYKSGTFVIYEYLGARQGFARVLENNLYIPVIYTNGRGNKFNEARKEGWVYDQTPDFPEDINLLTGKFKAFYTSDGFSSGFKLPIWQLDDTMPGSCRIYDDADHFVEWLFAPSNRSSTHNFNGFQVTASLDCSTGYVRFTCNGNPYAIPKSDHLNGNNVMIIAHKKLPNSQKAVLSSRGALMFEDKIYLYGNDFYKNEIYCSSSDNPLYFPESMKTAAGNCHTKVNRLFANGKSLFAFKDDGIYKISSNEQINNTDMILPIDVGRNYKITNRLKSTELSQIIGCENDKSIKACGENTVFLSSDRKLCMIRENGKISEISSPVNGLLSSLEISNTDRIFAVSYDKKYLLFIGNRAFLLEYNTSDFGYSKNRIDTDDSGFLKWYYLEFPAENYYSSAVAVRDTPYIICRHSKYRVAYIMRFSGDTDIIPNPAEQGTRQEKEIEFKIKTNPYDFGYPATKKGINFTELFVSGDGTYGISIDNGTNASTQNIRINGESVIKIYPFLMPSPTVSAEITGTAPFSLSKLSFEYTVK